jgi:hypothetical protein
MISCGETAATFLGGDMKSHAVLAHLVLFTPSVLAAPLTLVMTQDELRAGKAVLAGDIDPSIPTSGGVQLTATLGNGSATKHWSLELLVIRSIHTPTNTFRYALQEIKGKHISNPPPDPGELSPGPGLGPLFFSDLGGVTAEPTMSQSVNPSHDGHEDKMKVDLLDLNGGVAGVLNGLDHEIRVNITFSHAPEPAAGLLALAPLCRRKRR